MSYRATYTTSAAIRASGSEASEAHKAKYHLRAGAQYLHWSASKLTDKRTEAWTGSVEQARACRRTFSAAAGCRLTSIKPIPVHQDMEA